MPKHEHHFVFKFTGFMVIQEPSFYLGLDWLIYWLIDFNEKSTLEVKELH